MKKWLVPISFAVSFSLGLAVLFYPSFSIPEDYVQPTSKSPRFSTQNPNITYKPDYPLPPNATNSDEPLPQKVQDSFENILGLTVQFKTNRSFLGPSNQVLTYGGTGFLEKQSGLIVGARHVFLDSIIKFRRTGSKFKLDQKGLPQSQKDPNNIPYYEYYFFGSSTVSDKSFKFPIQLAAMGKLEEFQDYAAFRGSFPTEIKALELEEKVKKGDTLYNAGQIPLFIDIESMDPSLRKEALFDTLRYSFKGVLSAIITDLPINKFGLKKLYRIRMDSEFGFSGGPVFNTEGKVVGITILRIENFAYAISAEDIRSFLKKIK